MVVEVDGGSGSRVVSPDEWLMIVVVGGGHDGLTIRYRGTDIRRD